MRVHVHPSGLADFLYWMVIAPRDEASVRLACRSLSCAKSQLCCSLHRQALLCSEMSATISTVGGTVAQSLFVQLKNIGIEEELAHQVSASLDPDYNASKKDILAMQATILQVQLKSEQNYSQMQQNYSRLQAKIEQSHSHLQRNIEKNYHELRSEIVEVKSELRTEIHTTINRQYLLTSGGLLITIVTVVAVNWYFH